MNGTIIHRASGRVVFTLGNFLVIKKSTYYRLRCEVENSLILICILILCGLILENTLFDYIVIFQSPLKIIFCPGCYVEEER